jgi:protein-tyrosine phosphatase
VETLNGGGLVVVPTETVYAVAGRLDRPDAVARLRGLRSTPTQGSPLTLHVGAAAAALPFLDELTAFQKRTLSRLWPGPVSMVFVVSAQRRQEVARRLRINESDLYERERITIRCPAHALTGDILGQCGGPVGALAAPSRGGPPAEVGDLAEGLRVDLTLDDGRARFGRASTVVEVGPARYTLVRPGAVEERVLERMLKTTILFVCSGNTCRSPMAAALARRVLADQLKMREEDLEQGGVSVISAGVSAMAGAPATEHAAEAVRSLGGNLSRHRSRALTTELIRQADRIWTMGRSHAAWIAAMAPSAAEKTRMLDPSGDILDPIGGDLRLYEELAARLKSLIERQLAADGLIQMEPGT